MVPQDPKKPPDGIAEPSVPDALRAVVRAGVRANREVPGAVALGGTVCAMYAHHRLSMDIDFVVSDLRDRFDLVREHMLDVAGWSEANVHPPVLLLGSLDGVEVGFRQLRRGTPLQTTTIETPDGPLTIPTLPELLRTKAYLLYHRNAIRDYIDFASLARLLSEAVVVEHLADLDRLFAWEKQPSILLGVLKALLRAEPTDFDARAFESFRWITRPFDSWASVQAVCRGIGGRLAITLDELPS